MRIGHGYGKVFGALFFGSCVEVMEWLRKKGLDTRKFISSSNFPQGVPAFVRIIIFYEGHRHRWQTALVETVRFWGILIFHILSKQNCGGNGCNHDSIILNCK